MSAKPFLSQRRIVAYNRLHSDVVAMTYVLRFNKPGGPLGVHTVRACHNVIRAANRLYRREADIPGFRQVFEDEPMTMADLSILLTRLTAAGLTFEERYAHYTKEGLLKSPKHILSPALDADGFPSKHV